MTIMTVTKFIKEAHTHIHTDLYRPVPQHKFCQTQNHQGRATIKEGADSVNLLLLYQTSTPANRPASQSIDQSIDKHSNTFVTRAFTCFRRLVTVLYALPCFMATTVTMVVHGKVHGR